VRSVAERLRNLEKRHQARLAIRKSAAPPAAEVIVAMLSAGDWQNALKLLDLDVWQDQHSLGGGGARPKRMGGVCADLIRHDAAGVRGDAGFGQARQPMDDARSAEPGGAREHHQGCAINSQMQLLLTDKTTAIDPHTGRPKIIQNEGNSRFFGKNGDLLISDDPYFDPMTGRTTSTRRSVAWQSYSRTPRC